jgi:pilus assembly protein Flp/PilA
VSKTESKHIALRAVTAAHLRLRDWRDTATARVGARSDQGQTSVEYLGIIAVVVLIVAAIAGTNIGQTIYNAIVTQIAKVAK